MELIQPRESGGVGAVANHGLNLSLNAKVASGAAAIFAGFAILYASLRSKDIFATDGAHRCLLVFHKQTIFFNENNHLLYPVNVWIWTKLASALGMKADGPFTFYRIAELMNCFSAAASLAIVFLLIYITVSSWKLSLGAVIALGLSKAFFLQAINANEAVVGLFWSLIALFVLASTLSVKSKWLIFVSGLLFSLSMASYESMIFLAPSGLVLIWQMGAGHNPESGLWRGKLVAEGAFLAGCAAAWLGIHGWADWMTGNTRPAEMVKQLFRMQDARSYLSVGPGKGINLPIGLVRNVYPVLNSFIGLRHVLTGSKNSLIAFLLVFGLFGLFLIFCAWQLWSNWKGLPERQRIGLLAGLVGLVCTLIPLLIWDPQYDKLWLQPLTILAFLIAVTLKIPAGSGRLRFSVFRVAPVILLAGVFFNFPLAISAHRADVSAYFREAREVSQRVGPNDLVVADWAKVSVLYGDVWAPENRFMDFVSEAVFYGRGATERLRDAVSETQRRGGRVYFLGLLDESESEFEWNAFIGSRCGVPISDIEPYRANSTAVAIYRDGTAAVTLRELDPSFRE
jgi:hypothetical protein